MRRKTVRIGGQFVLHKAKKAFPNISLRLGPAERLKMVNRWSHSWSIWLMQCARARQHILLIVVAHIRICFRFVYFIIESSEQQNVSFSNYSVASRMAPAPHTLTSRSLAAAVFACSQSHVLHIEIDRFFPDRRSDHIVCVRRCTALLTADLSSKPRRTLRTLPNQ